MSRLLRLIVLWLPLSLLLIVVLVGGAVSTRYVQTRAAHWAVEQLNTRIRGRVELGSAHVRWNGDVELRHLRLRDEHGQPIAGFDTLRARIAVAELPDRVAHLRLLIVHGLRATVVIDSSGANLAAALSSRQPASAQPSAKSDWRVVIDELALRADCTTVTVDTTAVYRSARWLLSGSVSADSAAVDYSLTFDDPGQLSVDAGGRIGLTDSLPALDGNIGLLLDSAFVAAIVPVAAAGGSISGHAQYRTERDSLRARVDVAAPALGALNALVALPYPPNAAVRGVIEFAPLTPSVFWGDSARLTVRGRVEFEHRGRDASLNDWFVAATLDTLSYSGVTVAPLEFSAESQDSVLSLHGFGRAAAGSFALDATVNGFDPTTADGSLEAVIDDLVLQRIVADLPDTLSPLSGTIRCAVEDAGSERPVVAANVELRSLRLGQYVIDSLRAALRIPDGEMMFVDSAQMWAYGFPVSASARGGLTDTVRWTLDIAPAAIAGLKPLRATFPILDSLSGRLQAGLSGVISLRPADSLALSVAGDLHAANVSLGSDSVSELTVRIQSLDFKSSALKAVARLRGIHAAGQIIDSLALRADGSWSDLAVALRLWARQDSLAVSSDLRLQTGPDELRIVIQSASALAFNSRWETEGVATVTVQGTGVSVDALRINSPFGSLLATGTVARPGEQDFAVELSGIHLAEIAKLTNRELPAAVLNIRAQFTGPDSSLSGDLSVHIDSVIVRDTPVLDAVRIEASASGTVTSVDLLFVRNGDSLAYGHGALPVRLTFEGGFELLDSVPMLGLLTLNRQSLDVLNSILPYGSTVAGVVSGDFMILGSPAIPNWSGTLRLDSAAYRDRRYGINYDDVSVELAIERDTLRVSRLAVSSGGTVTGSGVAVMAFPAPKNLDLTLKFDNFQAVNSRQLQARLSGSVDLSGPLDSIRANGDMRFHEALYRITQASTKQIETIDIAAEVARLRGDTTAHSRSLVDQVYAPMSHAIHIEVPGNMWLRGGGVNVELAGELWLYKDPRREPYINGDIFVRKGTVEVLGHEFRVPEDSGRVSFKGDIANPELEIHAFYTTPENEELSVTLSGTLLETRSALAGRTANGDSMSVEQVLKSLVKSFIPTGGSGGASLEQQVAAATLDQLSSVVGRAAGLDLLRYRASDDGALTQGSLEVGTYVTDRLFIRVLQPVESIQTGQEVTVEYRLLDWLKMSALQYGKEASEIKAVLQFEWR